MKFIALIVVLMTLSLSAFAERCGCTARDEASEMFYGTSTFSREHAASNAITLCEMRTEFPGTCRLFGACSCDSNFSAVKNVKSAEWGSAWCNAMDADSRVFYGTGSNRQEAAAAAMTKCDYGTHNPGTCQIFNCSR